MGRERICWASIGWDRPMRHILGWDRMEGLVIGTVITSPVQYQASIAANK